MKIDVGLLAHDLAAMPEVTRAAEAIGFDGLWTFETTHEPFLPAGALPSPASRDREAGPDEYGDDQAGTERDKGRQECFQPKIARDLHAFG